MDNQKQEELTLHEWLTLIRKDQSDEALSSVWRLNDKDKEKLKAILLYPVKERNNES